MPSRIATRVAATEGDLARPAPRPGPPAHRWSRPRLTGSGATALGLYALFAVISLLQQPGMTTYDTRAELTQRPVGFLAEAFSLWHPVSNFGEFQNQAYGYLFPQGTWFVLTDALGMADWVSQRLWSALVLIVACEGARRVSRVVGLPGPAALVAGLAFGFSPRLLGTVSVITGEALPGAVMPWVVLPILLALSGRLSPRRAALLSGAAVVCMGGVNAVENAGSLPLALIVVVWGVRRGLVGRRFFFEWVGAVALASFWWVLPLLVLAGYAPPFYEYVESAANTTSLIGWSEAVRGDSHWVAYLITGDRSWWPAAHDLVSSPPLIVLSAVLSAIGLVGLARMRHPLRGPLVLAFVVGIAALTIARGGWEGSPLDGQVRVLLDGPLQIFRNVHKIDPVVRLPLAIGFGHAVAVVLARVLRWRPSLEANAPALLLVPTLLVLSLGQPYLVNHSRTPGWDEIAQPWQDAERYLAAHQDGRTTLVLPGSGFAQEQWGWTLDEPLLVLGGAAMASRSQVPLIPGQSIRFLDALDQLTSTGRATASLTDQLARAGIGHVVVRRDLDRSLTGSPDPSGASVSSAAGGLHSVAAYGEQSEGGAEVEVLEVPERLPELRATAVSDVVTVAGAPESILPVQDSDLVTPARATVLAGEPGWRQPIGVVTDGDQRRERAFGVNDEAVSAVLEQGDAWRNARAVHNYPTVPDARQVVARYDNLRQVSASSSQGYADNFGAVVPQGAPAAAIDGDPATRWVTSSATDPVGQWLRLTFTEPRAVHEVTVLPVVDDPNVVPVREIEVRAGGQRVRVQTSPSGAPSVVALDGSVVASVEVRVVRAATDAGEGRVGLREVGVDGLEMRRSLVVPQAVGSESAWLFGTSPERRACVVTLTIPDCDVRRIRAAEEPAGLDRTFTATGTSSTKVRGRVVARSTFEAARLLEPGGKDQTVGASSVFGADPKVSSRFAFDGQPSTAWVSSDDDLNPTLIFQWSKPQRITSIAVATGSTPDGPVAATLVSGDDVRQVALSGGIPASFEEPLKTKRLEVRLTKAPGVGHVVVPEISLGGVDVVRALSVDTRTGAKCGLGPNIEVGGQVVHTRVKGTIADIVNGTPLKLAGCLIDGGPQKLVLPSGTHRLTAPPSAEFQVIQVAGVPDGLRDPAPVTTPRTVSIRTWGAEHRSADVGPGVTTVLSFPENFNAGWVATAGGHKLQALRVDGWQQGFVLPAGRAGRVELTYAPQATYSVLLPLGLGVSGLVLLAGLIVLVGCLRRRPAAVETPWPTPAGEGGVPPLLAVVVLAAAVLLLGPAAAVGLAGGLLAGVLTRGRRTRRWTSTTVAGLGGLLVVLSAVGDVSHGPTWTGSVADAAAALGVGLLVGTVLGPLRRRHVVGSPPSKEAPA